MRFSPEQNRALQSVAHWLESSDRQVFRLFGYAGTGKTTLARHFAEHIDGAVHFAAFTGKAAYVLQQKGCRDATTIHKLIYIPRSKSSYRLGQLRERLKNTDPEHPKAEEIRRKIKEEEENLSRPSFQLNLDSPLNEAKLLIVDEVSMVDESMGRDLESFGCKILVLGDPAQLPPIYGAGYFISGEPDVMLTEIHRQARDNPIIHLATRIREGDLPRRGEGAREARVIGRGDITPELMLGADQLLVGKNKTRVGFNNRIRELRGFDYGMPRTGDRLVCLRNDHEVGLLNGQIWLVDEALASEDEDDMVDLALRAETGDDQVAVVAHRAYFQGEKPDWWDRSRAQEFDFGYALTCHKAQGSEWPEVVVYDERMGRGREYQQWLYTAVTRASEKVTLIR